MRGLDEPAAVDGVAHGQSHLGIVEGRLLGVHDDVVGHALGDLVEHHLRHRLLQLLHRPLGRLARHGRVELPGLEGGRARPPFDDDHVPEPIEVRPPLDEVVGVLDVLDELSLAPLLELERPGADAGRAVLGGRDVGGVDGRVARGQHHEQRGLRPLQAEHDGVRVRRLHVLHVGVPVLARVDPELGRRIRGFAQHVERELDVLRGEGLAVMPLHVLAEEEDEVLVVVLPRPLLGQVADDGLQALGRLGLVEEDEVVEARERWEARRVRGCLVDGEALGQVLAQHDVEGAARLRGLRGGGADTGDGDARGQGESQRGGQQVETPHCVSSPSDPALGAGRITTRRVGKTSGDRRVRGLAKYTRSRGWSQLVHASHTLHG